jgi:hypothetical protein
VLGLAFFFLVSVWQFAAMVIAVRQALDYSSTWRALGVVAIGFVVAMVLTLILGLIFGGSS